MLVILARRRLSLRAGSRRLLESVVTADRLSLESCFAAVRLGCALGAGSLALSCEQPALSQAEPSRQLCFAVPRCVRLVLT